MKKAVILSITALFMFTINACKKSASYDCGSTTYTYSSDIKPIMDAKCATSGCHDSKTKSNGIDLSSYEAVKTESANERFLGSIQQKAGFDKMPQGGSPLAGSDIQKIWCWVNNGKGN